MGCTGIPTESERHAQTQLASISIAFNPAAYGALPKEASLQQLLAFALQNNPTVQASYHEWAASVHRITIDRSLPDPKLTFTTDIQEVVMGVMPGLMIDFPGPGKLKWAANVASSESQARYYQFETAVLRKVYSVKRAYYQLHFLAAKIEVNREMQSLMSEFEKLARVRHESGAVTLQDVLRAQIGLQQTITEGANLEDSKTAMLADFKAALGLAYEDADPPSSATLRTNLSRFGTRRPFHNRFEAQSTSERNGN